MNRRTDSSERIVISGSVDSYIYIDGNRLLHDSVDYPIVSAPLGEFATTLRIPIDQDTLVLSQIELKVEDNAGRTAYGTVGLKSETIALEPEEGLKGTVVQVEGSGFIANVTGDDVRYKVLIKYGKTHVATAYPDKSGAFKKSFITPSSVLANSSNEVSATVEQLPSMTAKAVHRVPGPEIDVRHTIAGPGEPITVSGTGFPAYKQISIGIGHLWAAPPPVFYTDELGKFQQTVIVPIDLKRGKTTLTAYAPWPTRIAVSSFIVRSSD